MRDRKVSKVIIDAAEDAFFETLAKLLPDVKTGDLDPEADARFQVACREVAEAWYAQNATQSATVTLDKTTIRVMMRPPRKGERGYWVEARDAEEALAEILRESEELGWVWTVDETSDPDDYGMIAVTIAISVEHLTRSAP